MKNALTVILCFALVLLSAGCGNQKNGVNIGALKEKYPEYFQLSDFKGIEVYVWETAEDTYRCGLMQGTNRLKTAEEISALQNRSLSVEETKAILDEIAVKKEAVFVYPITQPYSGDSYEPDDEYSQSVYELFQ